MRRFCKLIAEVLIVCMVWTPFSLQAAMVGTDQVMAGAQEQENRDKVIQFVQRDDVAKQLEAFGLTSANAQERVNSMTQQEINQLAGSIDTLPAGAVDTLGWVLIAAVVGAAIWYLWYRR